jgi:exonuclease SbcD
MKNTGGLPMKFLHLSDLHIGKTVNGFSMLEEQCHVFEQIIRYIDAEKPDAVLIAGDVYDRAVPSVEAVRLFDDFLTNLAAKEVTVILISGNHDSPERLNYASRLLSERKLHLCGVFDGVLRSVTLSDTHGDVTFWMLPFIKPSGVRGLFADREVESYTDAINAALESADIDYSKRNVLLSHQFYTTAGVTPIRSESEINPVGGLDAVDAGLLARFDYVALGHLHGSQGVGGNVRYTGSPIKYSFSEWKQAKAATLVQIEEKGSVTVTALPLTPLRDMREIKGSLEQLLSDEVSAQGNKEDYLRVILTDEDEIIDPMGKIRSVYPNVMALDFENSRTRIDVSGTPPEAGQLEKLSPYDLFSEFFLEMSGGVMSEEQMQIVRTLLEKEGEE